MSRKRGVGAYTIRHAKFLSEEGSDRSPFQGVQQSSNRRVDPAAAAAPVYAVPAHLRQRGARLSIRVRPELSYNTTLYMCAPSNRQSVRRPATGRTDVRGRRRETAARLETRSRSSGNPRASSLLALARGFRQRRRR
ncbi:unnamed protein product [Ixodes pacificus]